MKTNLSQLAPSLIFPLVVGLTSAYLTIEGINGFYEPLIKPPLTPPSWVFGPVWTYLYLTMGISLYLFWSARGKASGKQNGYIFFILQLIANFLWSLLFFNLHSPLWALVDIVLMCVLTVANIYFFDRVSRNSALLLLPYLVWILFATYLNAGILLLN
jgi:tryptophan-rich sensory protein